MKNYGQIKAIEQRNPRQDELTKRKKNRCTCYAFWRIDASDESVDRILGSSTEMNLMIYFDSFLIVHSFCQITHATHFILMFYNDDFFLFVFLPYILVHQYQDFQYRYGIDLIYTL